MAIQADPTLVKGAWKQEQAKAMSNIVDMRPRFKSDKVIAKTITDTMTSIMGNIKLNKEKEKVAFEKGLEPFKSIANQAYEKLYSQDEPLPQKFIDAVTGEVERLQDDFEKVNTKGKGDTRANERERMRIQGELKRITNEAINTRASFMKIGQSAGNWNEQFIDPNNVVPMQGILDLENADKNDNYKVAFIDGKLTVTIDNVERTGTRTSVGFIEGSENEDGMPEIDYDSEILPGEEYKYTESVSFNLGQMEKALPPKNKATDAQLVQDITDNEKMGLADAKAGNPSKWTELKIERAEHTYASTIKTPEQFQDNIREIDGIGNGGFVEALWSNVDIPIAVIQTMFVDNEGNPTELGVAFNQLNVDNSDNVINEKDYEILRQSDNWGLFEKNIDALHNALTNVNNPAFHLQTSVDLLAKYKVAHDIQAYNTSYNEEMGDVVVGVEKGALNRKK